MFQGPPGPQGPAVSVDFFSNYLFNISLDAPNYELFTYIEDLYLNLIY